ncbi:MAG TPA: 3-oxoacyl-ACP reductase family protein [Symbiobacteriaceae bacterium]|nr:3-oxoacyl-ACP reductase family protein [Symbiobacteriaceae bacterium]
MKNLFTLKDRTAIVTGGSRGIGRAICLALGAAGANVVVNYATQPGAAEEVAAQIRSGRAQAMALRADVSDAAQVADMVAQVADRFRRIDILVNNAGIMTDATVADMTDQQWHETVAVNLTGVFLCCRAVIPYMTRQRFGRIISVTSQAAFVGSARHAHYAAAKAGVLGFSWSLARELGPLGITVNTVSPGRVLTDMLGARMNGRAEEWLAQTPLGRLADPAEMAGAVVFLASDAASYVTGENTHVNGGIVMG